MNTRHFLIAHFEKIIFALVVPWFGHAAYGLLWKPPQLNNKVRIEQQINDIEDYAAKKEPIQAAIPDWDREVKNKVLPERVPEAPSFPGWVFHRRPQLIYQFAKREPPPEAVHKAPISVRAAPARGRITVSWQPTKDNAFVLIEKYEVLRRSGQGEYEALAEVKEGASEYVDTEVNARSEYSYKIRSIARLNTLDPVVEGRRIEDLTEAERARDSASTDPVRIPREVIIVPLTWVSPTIDQVLAKGPERNLQGKVSFFVCVNIGEGDNNHWVRAKFSEIEGGLKEPRIIGTAKGATLKIRGEKERINFYTGAVLLECGEEPKDGTYMVIRYEDGQTERVRSRDKARELEGVFKKKKP